MNNETKHEKMLRLYYLATSKEYEQIKEELIEYIIKASTGGISPERITGMLNILNIPEAWISDYQKELRERRKEEAAE